MVPAGHEGGHRLHVIGAPSSHAVIASSGESLSLVADAGTAIVVDTITVLTSCRVGSMCRSDARRISDVARASWTLPVLLVVEGAEAVGVAAVGLSIG